MTDDKRCNDSFCTLRELTDDELSLRVRMPLPKRDLGHIKPYITDDGKIAVAKDEHSNKTTYHKADYKYLQDNNMTTLHNKTDKDVFKPKHEAMPVILHSPGGSEQAQQAAESTNTTVFEHVGNKKNSIYSKRNLAAKKKYEIKINSEQNKSGFFTQENSDAFTQRNDYEQADYYDQNALDYSTKDNFDYYANEDIDNYEEADFDYQAQNKSNYDYQDQNNLNYDYQEQNNSNYYTQEAINEEMQYSNMPAPPLPQNDSDQAPKRKQRRPRREKSAFHINSPLYNIIKDEISSHAYETPLPDQPIASLMLDQNFGGVGSNLNSHADIGPLTVASIKKPNETTHKENTPKNKKLRNKANKTKKNENHKQFFPKSMRIALVLMFIFAAGLIVANGAMTAYLSSADATRITNHKRVVNNHPIYYKDVIIAHSDEYNLQPAYITAIIKNESSFKADARSSVGALGLMQLMPDTAEWVAHKVGDDDAYSFERMADPETNIKYGCWYLSYLSQQFNYDPILVTAAYHTGQGQVSNWLANSDISKDGRTITLDSLPEGPTKEYTRRVNTDYAIYSALYFD